MDILSARKKAAERAKKKKSTPEQQVAAVPPVPEPEAPARPPERAEVAQAPAAPVQPLPDAPPAEEPAPGEESAETAVQELETLAFRLGSEEYVVMVDQVKEVLKMRDLTPVPHAPDYISGVISLRGAVLPVIDLAKRFSLAPGARDEKSRIVVANLDDEDAGLIVDRVTGVVRFSPDAVQPPPETVEGGAGAEFLKGIVRKEGKLYILLDIEKAAGR